MANQLFCVLIQGLNQLDISNEIGADILGKRPELLTWSILLVFQFPQKLPG
jgi:hypothetical protein